MGRLVLTLICTISLGLVNGCGNKFTPEGRALLVGQGALSLRQAGLRDIRPALEQFATAEAIRKFDAFDEKIWNFTNPKVGWSYFFNTSVIAFGNASGKKPVVAF